MALYTVAVVVTISWAKTIAVAVDVWWQYRVEAARARGVRFWAGPPTPAQMGWESQLAEGQKRTRSLTNIEYKARDSCNMPHLRYG